MKAAVIGAGAMGANHCRVYSEMEGVELSAVCDKDKSLSEKAAKEHSCKAYCDVDELLRDPPDAVTVAVPTKHHRAIAQSCIEAGVDVLVEKPISDTVENAKAIIEAAEKAGVKLMVGHIERFNPAVQELKKRIDAGELGRVFSINATRVGPFPHRIRDVGVVIDLAVHDIDAMRYLTGAEVKRVYAETEKRIHTSYEDMLSGLLKFDNEVVGVLDVNWLTPEKIRSLAVTGEKGMYLVKYITQELIFYENRQANGEEYNYQDILMGVSEGDITQIRVKKREPLRAELEAFVNSDEAHVTGLDGLRSLEVALAIKESATDHQVINI